MIHALKILPEFFKAMAAGTKSFEVRKNDRPYHTGDYVALNEWNSEQYTGKCTLQKIVYILNDPEYCKEGYVILGLEPCAIGEIRESRRIYHTSDTRGDIRDSGATHRTGIKRMFYDAT